MLSNSTTGLAGEMLPLLAEFGSSHRSKVERSATEPVGSEMGHKFCIHGAPY